MDDSKVRKVFARLLTKAGLAQCNLHFLRHTFASLLIQQGESLAYVKEQMGHSSIDVTVDTYGHLVPGGNRQAVDKLDDGSEIPDQFGVETKWKHFEPKVAPEEKAALQVIEKNWSHPPESNRRPTDYESVALPTELGWLRWA